MGWFFGFKLHLICNEKGELLNFMITPGDVDDRKPLDYKPFVEFLYGKLVGDKGYIGKELFQRLFVDGIQLITKLKSNMKGAIMSMSVIARTYIYYIVRKGTTFFLIRSKLAFLFSASGLNYFVNGPAERKMSSETKCYAGRKDAFVTDA